MLKYFILNCNGLPCWWILPQASYLRFCHYCSKYKELNQLELPLVVRMPLVLFYWIYTQLPHG